MRHWIGRAPKGEWRVHSEHGAQAYRDMGWEVLGPYVLEDERLIEAARMAVRGNHETRDDNRIHEEHPRFRGENGCPACGPGHGEFCYAHQWMGV